MYFDPSEFQSGLYCSYCSLPYLSLVRYFHLLHLVSVVTRRHNTPRLKERGRTRYKVSDPFKTPLLYVY